jgi:hypothetical protein
LVSGDAAMIFIHSSIDLPYFFSMAGKLIRGPLDGLVTMHFSLRRGQLTTAMMINDLARPANGRRMPAGQAAQQL